MSDPLWDIGAQNERTRLSWQRTALSGLACSLLVARLLATVSIPVAVLIGAAAVLSTAALAILSSQRYADNQAALHARRPTADGRAPLIVTTLMALTAVASLMYVLLT